MFPLANPQMFFQWAAKFGEQKDSKQDTVQRTQVVAQKNLVSSSAVPCLKSRSWCRLLRCLFHLLIDKIFHAKLHRTPLAQAEENTKKIRALTPAEEDTKSLAESISSNSEDESLDDCSEEIVPNKTRVSVEEPEAQRKTIAALTLLNSPGKRMGVENFMTCAQALELPSNQLNFNLLAPSHAFHISDNDQDLDKKLEELSEDQGKIALPVILSDRDEHIVQIFIDVNQKKLELFDPMGRAAKDNLSGRRKIRGMHIDLATLITKLAKKYDVKTVDENTEQYQKDMHSCGLRGLLATHLFLHGITKIENKELSNQNFKEAVFRQFLFDKVYDRHTQKPEASS